MTSAKNGGSRPPLPHMSAKIRIWLTPPPPYVSQHQNLPAPPLATSNFVSTFLTPLHQSPTVSQIVNILG